MADAFPVSQPEQLIRNQQVPGSNPGNGSDNNPPLPPTGLTPRSQREDAYARLHEMESDPTFRALMARYLAEETPLKAPSTRRHDHSYARILEVPLGDVPIAEISPRVVSLLHRELTRTRGPIQANRVLSMVSQVCRLAEQDDLRPANSNPTAAVRRNTESRRTDFLAEHERGPFLDAARTCVALGEVTHNAGLLAVLMLLAGLRWSSARALEWGEVDLRAGVLRLKPRGEDRQNKAGGEVVIPITDDVVELLLATPRVGKYVAPNQTTGRPYTDIRKPLRRICDRAGVEITPHGLRHSFGTSLAEGGGTQAEIGACMGHQSDATAARYIHLAGKAARRALLRTSRSVKGTSR